VNHVSIAVGLFRRHHGGGVLGCAATVGSFRELGGTHGTVTATPVRAIRTGALQKKVEASARTRTSPGHRQPGNPGHVVQRHLQHHLDAPGC